MGQHLAYPGSLPLWYWLPTFGLLLVCGCLLHAGLAIGAADSGSKEPGGFNALDWIVCSTGLEKFLMLDFARGDVVRCYERGCESWLIV